MPVHDGEFWCLPAETRLPLHPKRLPKPVSLYRFSECPEEVVRSFTDLRGVPWSPVTKQWSEEPVRCHPGGHMARQD